MGSVRLFKKHQLNGSTMVTRKIVSPTASTGSGLKAPLVFARTNSRGSYAKECGDLRISVVSQVKKGRIEHQISFRFSRTVIDLLSLKKGDRVSVATEDGETWVVDISGDESGYSLTQQNSSQTLNFRSAIDIDVVRALGLERDGNHIPAMLCDLLSHEDDKVTFKKVSIS